MYKYIHDAAARVVYRFPSEPDVSEEKDWRGKRVAWHARMEILITRADNTLTGNTWQHATSDCPTQSFDPGYTKDRVVSYFLMRHEPNGETISEEQYEALQSQYESAARGQTRE